MWKCRNCKESVDDNLDVCWNCGYSEEGKPPANREDFNEVKLQKRKRKTKRVMPGQQADISSGSFSKKGKMQTQRPIGVTLFVIWFFIAGIIAIAAGAIHNFFDALFLYDSKQLVFSGLRRYSLLELEIPRIISGVLLIAGGVGYCAAAVGLLQRREWGRRGGIAAAIAVSLGWIILGYFIYAFFGLIAATSGSPFVVYIVIGLINALPILYLIGDGIRVYCGGEARSAKPVEVGKRPSSVTAFAILAASSGVADLITGGIGISLVLAGAEFVVTWGLWQLKNWARIGFIILVVLNGLIFLAGLPSLFGNQPILLLGAAAVGLLFRGYFIYWMATNSKYFSVKRG